MCYFGAAFYNVTVHNICTFLCGGSDIVVYTSALYYVAAFDIVLYNVAAYNICTL